MAIGLNVHAMFSTQREKDELIAYHRAVDVDATLIMDDPGFALHMARTFPKTLIIYRRSGDNNQHLPGGSYISPEQWAANYLAAIPRPHPPNLLISYNNEPGVSRDLNDHALACAKQVAPYPDVKVAWLNLSVGVPNYNDWNLVEPFIRYICQSQFRERFFLGLHEYFLPDALHDWGYGADFRKWPAKLDGVGNLGGRWRAFDNWCASKGIDPCPLLITENGYDIISAYAGYQQSLLHTHGFKSVGMPHANVVQWEAWIHQHGLGMSWQQYAAEGIYRAHRLFYNTPRIRGVCLFCYAGEEGYDESGDPKWRRGFDYSKSSMPQFLPYLEKKDWSKMATNPPTPTITPTHFVSAVAPVASNVRDDTTTKAAIVRVLSTAGELVKYNNSRALTDGYVWDNYTFMDGKSGWVRTDVRKQVQLKPDVLLNVPYKKQFGDSTNDDRVNDCAAACIAMLLGFEGIEKTVDEVTAVINRPEGTVHFKYLTPAIHTLGFKSEVRQGTQLTDILASLNAGKPMMVLVNYEHLRGSAVYRYGHFVVPIGYKVSGQTLTLVVHDPYNAASMEFPVSRFAKAIGEMEGTSNSAFQSLFFTGQVTPPPPTPEDDSPVLFHVENLLVKARNEIDEAITAIRDLRPNIDL